MKRRISALLAAFTVCAGGAQSEPTSPRPTLWLIGDSTVRNNTRGLQGWGDPIKALFDSEKIRVENRALGGRSSRTFYTEGLWEKVRAELKPGDFLIMQFGHNDGGSLNSNRSRGSLKGTDDRTEEITLTNGVKEVVHTFGWYLRQYVTDAKARGATPLICSLIPRNDWKDGRILRGTNSYEFFAAEVARQEHVGYVDLHEIIARKYELEGQEAVTRKYFLNEHTHTTPLGAELNAACVVEGVRRLPETALKKYLRPAQEKGTSSTAPAFWNWAPTPPLGWNSWDCFATTVTEAQIRAQADVMAEKLAPHGWQYIVVDIQWYEPNAKSFEYRKNAELMVDEFGRLLPATNRFPSAANGRGFKVLADYVHDRGLKFGIHLMRGVPRQAVAANTPVKGTQFHARDIADTNSICEWNPDMFGVDMAKPGAQDYYNSVFELIASWGVDFVKVDDLSRPYPRNRPEVEAIRKAIDRTGRRMVLSTSPGETPVAEGDHVMRHANMWRISDDFWDKWPLLLEQFERCRKWAPFIGAGHFPDADMLPLGVLGMGKWTSHFTRDEQFTMLTLWSMVRSPLIMGGDLTKLDDFTLSLLTNDEVLAVNQHSSGNRQLFNRDGLIGWVADVPDSRDKYLALFNTRELQTNEPPLKVGVRLAELDITGPAQVRDLWRQQDLGPVTGEFAPVLQSHSAGLYRVASARTAAVERPSSTDRYLFSYFINNGEDGLHLAWSRDGYQWEALNAGNSFLQPEVGEAKLMRDPCLLRGPDETYHLVWTTAWQGQTIGYASSKDLVHWSAQRALPVMAHEPAAINCWAPEIVWDAKRGEFLIFWASTVTNQFLETAAGGDEKYNHRMYATTTRDFASFTPAQVFFDPGFNVIDATILAANAKFHLIVKDETRHPPKKHLRIASSDDLTGPYGNLSAPFTRDWVEGPTALKVGADWLVYFDAYQDHRYEALRSRDLQHWEDVTARISLPRGTRHGTALVVPANVIQNLLAARSGARAAN